MGRAASNVMLIPLPELEGLHRIRRARRRRHHHHEEPERRWRLPGSLCPLFVSNGLLLTTFLNVQLLLLFVLATAAVPSTRATPESEIAVPSAASSGTNSLRFNNNGLATVASNIVISRDVRESPTDSYSPKRAGNVNNQESIYLSNNNNSEGQTKSTRKRTSQIVNRLDPLSTTLSRSAPTKVIYSSTNSDRLESHPTRNGEEEEQQHQPSGSSSSTKGTGDENEITNVTSQLQTHTYLPCKLSPSLLKERQIANKSVSWVRVRDEHILTVDRITFITDDRFQAYYSESNGMWMLQIKWVQQRDAGIYECQVSTEPKVSAQVQLNVVVPKTELVGEQIRYVKDGSNVILRCVVRGALEPPIYISWFYGAKQIYNDSPRGWKIKLDRNVLDNEHDGSHSSVGSLVITSVRKRDSGNYTCSPSNSDEVTVMLHVINGEYSASAITSSSSRGRFSYVIVTIIISVFMFKMT